MKKVLVISGIALLVSVIAFLIWYFFFGIEVMLVGDENVTTTYKMEYHDLGIKVLQHDKEVSKEKYSVLENNDINIEELGNYTYTYDVKYLGRSYTLTRNVSVVDDVKPEIKVNLDKVTRHYCTKKDKEKLEYTIIDNYDGDIKDKAKEEELGDYYVITVMDSHDNESVLSLPITYTDKPKDIFKINGSSTIYVAHGNKYSDSGVTYTDGCGVKLSGVKTSGSVDVNKDGTYTITYMVNGGTLTRKVIVYTPSVNDGGTTNGKVIYLTFDDGPSSYTEKVLNTLAKYNVKATFFVTHQFSSYVPLIKKEYEQGHSVAVHTYTHNWNIYKSVDAYISDFNKMNEDILKYTGTKSKIFRFPGGSSNTVSRNYAKGVVKAIASKMTSLGYQYFDWDVDSGDAAGASRSKIYSNVVNGVKNCSKCIVLMHDIKANTVNELDNILNTLTSKGYQFGTLSLSSPTVHHAIAN